MPSVSQVATALQQILEDEARTLAKATGCIQRERALTGADLAPTLIFGWLQEPDLSLCGLSQVAGRREVSISASGLCQRFSQQSAAFLQALLGRLVQVQLAWDQAQSQVVLPLLSRFAAVIVEDSTSIHLPSQLSEVWSGRNNPAALLKLFVRLNLSTGALAGPLLTPGRQSDSHSPFDEQSLPAGSLYVADLGFFCVDRLQRLAHPAEGDKRFFMMRYKHGTRLQTRGGHRLELAGVLPQQPGACRELGVLLGQQQRLPVRLIMLRVPEEVAEQRREQARQQAHEHGREVSAESLYLAQWTIVLTNVPRRLLSWQEALEVLGARWQIERLFRLWTHEGRLDKWNSQKPYRILTEIYAKLAAQLIGQWLISAGCWADPHRSLDKAAQVVRRESNRIMVALWEGGLEGTLTSLLRCFGSGCQVEKRTTFPSTAQRLCGMAVGSAKRPSPPKGRRRGKVRYWPAGRGWAYAGQRSRRKKQAPRLT